MKRSLSHAIAVIVVVMGVASTGAYADWTDTFDNNTFDQSWSFFSSPAGGTASITDVPSTTDDHLALNGGGGLVFGAGLVSESFTDVVVTGWVNETGDNAGNYPSLTDHMLLGRTSLTVDGLDGYGVLIDWELAGIALSVTKIDNSAFVDGNTAGIFFPSPDPENSSGPTLDQRLWVQLRVLGSINPTVIGRVFDAPGGNLLASVSYTDSGTPFTSGFSGVAVIADNAGSGYVGSFDNVSSVVPEPTSILLLIAGAGSVCLRRRKAAVSD